MMAEFMTTSSRRFGNFDPSTFMSYARAPPASAPAFGNGSSNGSGGGSGSGSGSGARASASPMGNLDAGPLSHHAPLPFTAPLPSAAAVSAMVGLPGVVQDPVTQLALMAAQALKQAQTFAERFKVPFETVPFHEQLPSLQEDHWIIQEANIKAVSQCVDTICISLRTQGKNEAQTQTWRDHLTTMLNDVSSLRTQLALQHTKCEALFNTRSTLTERAVEAHGNFEKIYKLNVQNHVDVLERKLKFFLQPRAPSTSGKGAPAFSGLDSWSTTSALATAAGATSTVNHPLSALPGGFTVPAPAHLSALAANLGSLMRPSSSTFESHSSTMTTLAAGAVGALGNVGGSATNFSSISNAITIAAASTTAAAAAATLASLQNLTADVSMSIEDTHAEVSIISSGSDAATRPVAGTASSIVVKAEQQQISPSAQATPTTTTLVQHSVTSGEVSVSVLHMPSDGAQMQHRPAIAPSAFAQPASAMSQAIQNADEPAG